MENDEIIQLKYTIENMKIVLIYLYLRQLNN